MINIKIQNFNNKIYIAVFYILIFAFSIVACLKNSAIDVDFWSRLIMGHHVFNYGSVMKNDIISFSPTHIWYDYEWLSSTVFYVILKFLGLVGLTSLKIALCFLTFVATDFVICTKQKTVYYKHKYLYFFLLFVLIIYLGIMLRLRCQNFTFLFYPILIILLERYRLNKDTKTIYLIPPLMLIWLNCHAGSVFGMLIIVLYVFGELISRHSLKKLLIVLVLSASMYFINPWGAKFIPFLFHAILYDRTFITEWHSPFLLPNNIKYAHITILFIPLFLYLFGCIKNKVTIKTIDYTKLFIIAATFTMASFHIKHYALFFLSVFMFLYDDFLSLCNEIVLIFKKIFKKAFSLSWFVIIISVSYITYIFLNYPINSYYSEYANSYPLNAMQFIVNNNIKGNIFAPFYMSGFIAYKLYPDCKIYMDGRLEQVYSNEILKNEAEFLDMSKSDSYRILNDYPVEIILIEKQYGAYSYLMQQSYYKKVFEDELYSVWVAPYLLRFNYQYPTHTPDFTKSKLFDSKYFN